MAITVKDIREKEFAKQKRDGYMIEEVDDFLDEIADQLSVLIRENIALTEQVKRLESEPKPLAEPAPAAPVAPVVVPVAQPSAAEPQAAYDEPSYFKNLEIAMRDTLVNAQRLADDTIADARKKAQEMIESAEEQARNITSTANGEAESARVEAEAVQKSIANYRSAFRRLVEGQVSLIKDATTLFD